MVNLETSLITGAAFVVGVITGASPVTVARFPFLSGLHYPFGAKRLRIEILVVINGFVVAGQSANAERWISLVNPGTNQLAAWVMRDHKVIVRDTINLSGVDMLTVEVPLAANGLTSPSGAVDVILTETFISITAPGPFAFSFAQAAVIGWSMD
jgi:hypothetical protein